MTSSSFDHGAFDLRGRPDALFEIAHPAEDPEGLISKFVAYESYRIKREHHVFDMVGSLHDRLGVLFWYLTDYVRDRQGGFSVPLSAHQLAYLNGPAPIAGGSAAVTVALYNFVARERPHQLDLLDPKVLREVLYWWCVERAPLAGLEDRLVTEEQLAILRDEEQWIGEDYPFNAFMTLFFGRHPELHSLDMGVPRDRAAYFHYLLMYGFNNPHVMQLLPTEMVRRSLRGGSGGDPPAADRVFAHLVANEDVDDDDGCDLREMGIDLLDRTGWRVDQRRRRRPATDTGEAFRQTRKLDAPIEPGLALIGPIRKTSGLGQATRLSHDILTAAGRAPTVLVFDLDNPAPVGFASDVAFEPYRNRRAINLVHLNAESIPLAFAFEQRDIFAASYNIGYFFWELTAIPKCHHLALELLDEIWVSSEYNREIYARYTDKPVVNVGMAVESLPDVEPLDRAALGLDADSFVFLSSFDSFSFIERKNPLGVIEAFRCAFPLGTERVQLVLKTQNRGRVFDPHQVAMWKRIDAAVRRDPRIVMINETYRSRDLFGLKLACDCYVSLHRSEGWGFGMIEAMQLGRPVIATGYSGNMEFCTPDTAYLVDYDLMSVREEEYIFVERGSLWAQPRIATAAAHMRSVVERPALAAAKSAAAKRYIEAEFGVAAIARRYAKRLDEIERIHAPASL